MDIHTQISSIQQLYLFGIAALLGGLIGLERQFSKTEEQAGEIVGVRTFIFITIFGALSAMMSALHSPWFFVVSLVGMSSLVLVRYVMVARCGDLGITTEVVELLAFLIGAITYWGHVQLAVALAVGVTIVLSLKPELHRWTEKLGTDDIRAILKFAVLTFVILPVLPNRAIDKWGFFNPYEVWIMVVLISAVSFMGYLLLKFVKLRGGIEWTGAIGGLISSTATTLSFSRRSQTSHKMAPSLALGVLLACAILFPRLLVILGVVEPQLVKPLLLPFSLMFATGAIAGLLWWRRYRTRGYEGEAFEFHNPIEISHAITFGAVFAIVKVIAMLAEQHFGDKGLFVTAALSGFAELDAIALSVSRMVSVADPQAISAAVGAKAIVIATVSNSLVKAVIVALLASRGMKRPIIAGLVAMAAVGTLYLALIW